MMQISEVEEPSEVQCAVSGMSVPFGVDGEMGSRFVL